MPTILTATPPAALPIEPLRKLWTRDQCEQLEQAGLLDQQRLELVDGELINKMGKKRPHVVVLAYMMHWLFQTFGKETVNSECPIDVAPEDYPTNEPQPDLIVFKQPSNILSSQNPRPHDLHLVIEISDTSLYFDLTKKAALYACAGIVESEFAKLAFIVVMAHFLSRPTEELRQPVIFWKATGLMILPFILIMKEPDLGSAIVFVPVWFAMLFVAGVPRKFLVKLVAVVGVVAALFLVDVLFAPPGWQIKLHEYQRQRLLVYFGKDFAPENATPAQKAKAREEQAEKMYQGKQALISVGSGGVFGKGWLKGDQTALGFLPRGAAHNDFIFFQSSPRKAVSLGA